MRSGNRWARPWRVGAIVLSGAWLLASCGGGSSEGQVVVAVPKSLSLKLPASVESSTTAQFGSSAIALDGLKFHWDFGDGTTSDDAAPSHTYARGGEYEVKLTVKNVAGDSTETRSSIVVTSLANVRGLECSGPQSTGWCWQNPRPIPIEPGVKPPKFYFLDARTGFRSGEAGIIYATTDGGTTWKRQRTGASGMILDMRFLDNKTGWAVSSEGEVLRTLNGGDSWALAQPATYAQYVRMVVLNPKVIHVKLDFDRITYQYSTFYSSSDGGATWRRIPRQAELSPNGRIWVLEGSVLRSSDDAGLSFTQRVDFASSTSDGIDTQLDRLNLFVFSDTRLVVTRQNRSRDGLQPTGSLITSLDGGASWTSLNRYLPGQSFKLAWASPNGQVFIGEATSTHPKIRGQWVVTSDGGNSWTDLGPSSSTSDRGDVYTARSDGSVERYDAKRTVHEVSQDGLNWRPVLGCQWPFEAASADPIPGCLRESTTSSVQQYSLSDDGGKTWRVILDMDFANTPAQNGFFDGRLIDFSGAKRGFMIDANGDGRGTTDGGLTWQVKAPGLGKGRRLRFVGEQTVWLINAEGRLLTSKDGGQTWVKNDGETYNGQPNGPDVEYRNLGFENEKLGWYQRRYPSGDIVFTQYAVTVDGGLSWQYVSLPISPYFDVSMRLGSKAWLALRGERTDQELLVSLDQGKTWVSNRTPEYIGTPVFSDDETIWAISKFQGRAYRSDDYGLHWREVALPVPNVSPGDVQFANAKVGWIVGGMILATKDGGNTWLPQIGSSDIPSTYLQSLRVSDSQTAWAIGSDGSILATGTGGN